MSAVILCACTKPVLVSHLSNENARLTTRKGAQKHNLLSKAVCFNKNCRKFVGWRNKHKKRRFKGYKTPGIPKRRQHQQPPVIVDVSEFGTNDTFQDSVVSQAGTYDGITYDVPMEFKSATFKTNSYELTSEFQAELEGFASFLISNPNFDVQITGHTDDVGNRQENKRLSKNRAKAVVAYLVSQGVGASRLTYFGKGDSMPLYTGFGAESARANRRVAFRVKKNK